MRFLLMRPGSRKFRPTSPRPTALFGLALVFVPIAALAEAMPPDHGTATGAPLFVPDLPVGTISVRIARPSLTEPIVGTAVIGAWTAPGGRQASATAKTGSDGRAIFSDVPAGAVFGAKAEVEGETLTTAAFTVPAEGGTRLLMIVGRRAAQAMAAMTGHPGHGMRGGPRPPALRGGKVEPRDGLPAGVVEIEVLGPDGQALPGVHVDLVRAQPPVGGLNAKHADTDAAGLARFAELERGGRWLALVERDGLRVGSSPFVLDERRGSAGELRMPGRTSDLAVLRVSANSRMMVEPREDSLAFLQNLVVENTSDKVFDPGPRGLLVPLPDGCGGAERLPGGTEVEMKEGAGAILRGLLPPTDDPMAATQVRLGCVIGTHETAEVEIVQPMPLGLQGGLAMIPAIHGVGLSAPGLRARPAERDDNGNELRAYELDSVPPGQALRLCVVGLPTRGQTGKRIAGLLAGLLLVAGVVAARKPKATTTSGNG
ncbi:MAG: hypothetical protein JXP73_10515 [Deltaproteobacteria bacterium]|nr:hypothetical protein [Deltaproteobacteria bacterium]